MITTNAIFNHLTRKEVNQIALLAYAKAKENGKLIRQIHDGCILINDKGDNYCQGETIHINYRNKKLADVTIDNKELDTTFYYSVKWYK